MSDEEAYDAGLEKLGFKPRETFVRESAYGVGGMLPIPHPDLRKDDGFAWRVHRRLQEKNRYAAVPEQWRPFHSVWLMYCESLKNPSIESADALYATVCALGRSDDANT